MFSNYLFIYFIHLFRYSRLKFVKVKRVYTCIRDISRSHYSSDLLHALQIGWEATVAAEYLLVNNSCYRQAVETIRKCFPQFDIVPTLALIIETCHRELLLNISKDRLNNKQLIMSRGQGLTFTSICEENYFSMKMLKLT